MLRRVLLLNVFPNFFFNFFSDLDLDLLDNCFFHLYVDGVCCLSVLRDCRYDFVRDGLSQGLFELDDLFLVFLGDFGIFDLNEG